LVQKLPPRERDEWVKQVESEDYSEDMKGLAKWAQVRAKTMRKREDTILSRQIRVKSQLISSHQVACEVGSMLYAHLDLIQNTKV
jgi:hypothetical protein